MEKSFADLFIISLSTYINFLRSSPQHHHFCLIPTNIKCICIGLTKYRKLFLKTSLKVSKLHYCETKRERERVWVGVKPRIQTHPLQQTYLDFNEVGPTGRRREAAHTYTHSPTHTHKARLSRSLHIKPLWWCGYTHLVAGCRYYHTLPFLSLSLYTIKTGSQMFRCSRAGMRAWKRRDSSHRDMESLWANWLAGWLAPTVSGPGLGSQWGLCRELSRFMTLLWQMCRCL